jgi:hypothetical protein
MLNLEQTCNNPHLHSPARTVIRARLSAWACQPFCCQRTFDPSLSECSGCTGTRLAGLTRSPCANLPSSSASGSFELRISKFELPENKKPGVGRRAKPPHLGGSARCSTSFYPVLVKNLTLGSTSRLLLLLRWEDFFDPTVMPLNSPGLPTEPSGPSITIPAFPFSSSPRSNYFSSTLCLPVQIPSEERPSPGPYGSLPTCETAFEVVRLEQGFLVSPTQGDVTPKEESSYQERPT